MAPAPIPAPRASGFTTTTDLPLYWCAYGPEGAPRLLVLHGGPGASHEYLLPQLLDLADSYELVFYDQRGGGRSKTDDRTSITWETQVRDLERVVAELGISPLGIVGYSWGALLALLYARESSRGTLQPVPSRLALIDPAPVTRAWRDAFEAEFARRQQGPEIQAMRGELAASGLKESNPDAYRQRAFELSVAGYFADPHRATDLTPFRVTGRVQQSIWESLGEFDLLADLAAMKIPTLIVHGRQDPIPIASSEAAARAMGAEFVALDACGHVPYVEARGPLMAALHRFLSRTGSSGG
jgi:proline iminopeptidase